MPSGASAAHVLGLAVFSDASQEPGRASDPPVSQTTKKRLGEVSRVLDIDAFEYLLAYLGVRQKNGAPGHPQTQGKIERFHQTLKRWLERQPAARTLGELEAQLDAFRLDYNEHRPHRATGRLTPAEAYLATPKAPAAGTRAAGHFRLRYDLTDRDGRITLRRAGRLHHLKVGAAHARRRVLAIADERDVTVVALDTGEVLSTHLIEPDRKYWRNQRRDPGRWPRSRATG